MPYQSGLPPNRPSSGFDEPLRPSFVIAPASPQASGANGLGIINGPVRQPQPPVFLSNMPQTWPFMFNLEVLRCICPPLRPHGPDGPLLETHWSIIAVEGASTPILKEVAAAIERALLISSEFAVKEGIN
ncbi:hypothetical protein F5X97DRAFT_327869 [Nemania serpens]|nr:hypothetical protein F5X97DRAFT_327869 [Nemania serpens]